MGHPDFKNILLVHPLGYKKSAARQDVSRLANIMPPLGLASISAYLEQRGTETAIIDSYANPDSDLLIQSYLHEKTPAYLGISCTTSSFLDGVRIASMAKKVLPEIKVIFGGPHVSALKGKILEGYPLIDFCAIGEGEVTLSELIESGGEDAAKIEGLAYRDSGNGIHVNSYRSNLLELDRLPFPAYSKLNGYPVAYMLPIFNYPVSPNTSCISSRGCPYACSYCDRSVFQRTFRYNSAEYLYEHLRYLKDRFNIRHINFYDDQFTFNRKRVEAFAGLMIARPLNMTFNCAVRAEHIDMDLLLLMKRAGCWMISLGIESGDDKLLSMHRQNVNSEMMREKIHMIKKAGIRTKGLFMIGLPGETVESIKRSIAFYSSLPIDEINVAKFTPFPGTPLYEKIVRSGGFTEEWEKMDCMHFLYIPEGMDVQTLETYFIKFYKAHFSRLRTIVSYISMIWKSPESWKRFIVSMRRFLLFAKSNKRFN
ncbi:MAG: radical SAM protein [Deltaproteobacteria bacterium]|nr:radical SAM protein [Deltaproteobacteria bacterium]